VPSLKPTALLVAGLFAAPLADAADVVQKVKPPVAQAWVDLATFSGGMPAAPGGGGGMFGSIFGGGSSAAKGGNAFGNTAGGTSGRWMDVTLLTHNNPKLATATHAVPAGSKLAPSVKLVAPEIEKVEQGIDPKYVGKPGTDYKPKGKIYLYWGCGAEVRKGQPVVIDMAKMDPAQYAKFFQTRNAMTQVPQAAPGRPVWPNKQDDRMLPEGSSMAGEHAFTGEGVPDGFKFSLDSQHDLMPAIDAKRRDDDKGVYFSWAPMQQARGWFLAAMGTRMDPAKMDKAANGEMEMVYWTSSELPETGFALINYQPDGAVDKWLKEKVLLPAKTTECAAPKEAVGTTSMTRMIAYGDEFNMAYPPRPKDTKVTWEPQWDVKVRVKSVASLMPGMGAMGSNAMAEAMKQAKSEDGQQGQQQGEQQQGTPGAMDVLKSAAPSPFDLLRGVLRKK
jgi:hypothetical protein